MKLLFASDSFKGTLSSDQIIKLLNESAQRIFPGCETVGVPVADGGIAVYTAFEVQHNFINVFTAR